MYIYIYIYIYSEVMKTIPIQCTHHYHHNCLVTTWQLWMISGRVWMVKLCVLVDTAYA